MLPSLSHLDEAVFAACNALILVIGILIFAWWISRRPPLPPEPKKPKYAQRLQSQFKRRSSGKKQVTSEAFLSDSTKVKGSPAGVRQKKRKPRKPR
ncbi:MAG: hypothetical protein WAQ08_18420 [Aquabacterium sp.]|jgi:hypothetical protein|uniref:hypothetical protein n=1 Tax=Aquabacterium sp. TaxID=1872578 RepID=UPI003BB175D1